MPMDLSSATQRHIEFVLRDMDLDGDIINGVAETHQIEQVDELQQKE